MDNKAIVKQFIRNLTENQATAYEAFADNIIAEWVASGWPKVHGKDNLVKIFQENGHRQIVSQTIHNLIAEGDMVCASGEVVSSENGRDSKSYFADFYTLKDGKITALTSYVVTPQDNK